MITEEITVRDALGYEHIKTNPITTEAKNILNKLFKDELGFFDIERANRVEWFLPKEIKDMKLFVKLDFVKLNDCINFSHNLIEASHGYERQSFLNYQKNKEEKFNLYITQENKDFLKKEIVKFEKSNCFKTL